MHCGKDTGVFDDDITGSLVKHHLIEDVDNLTHKLIILLLGCIQKHKNIWKAGLFSHASKIIIWIICFTFKI